MLLYEATVTNNETKKEVKKYMAANSPEEAQQKLLDIYGKTSTVSSAKYIKH